MIVRLPTAEKWTPEFQARLNAAIEQALLQLNQYAQIPSGGGANQVLTKNSARDFDLRWTNKGT